MCVRMTNQRHTITVLAVIVVCLVLAVLHYRSALLQEKTLLDDLKNHQLIEDRRDAKLPDIPGKESTRTPPVKPPFPKATNEQMMLECSKVPSGGNVNSGIIDVKPLQRTSDNTFKPTDTKLSCIAKIVSHSRSLTPEEKGKSEQCVKTSAGDISKGQGSFWSGATQYVRHTHHKYLTSSSIVIDIGGNVGEDAQALMSLYNPNAYVILEPLLPLYQRLVYKFKAKPNVFVYNFGAGEKKEQMNVRLTGHAADATSIFANVAKTGCLLNVVNVTEFLLKVGVGCYEVDLLTINCEGCEFPILESILSSSIVSHFKRIQFATHTKLSGVSGLVPRYCEIQQLLSRTHEVTYQYKFCWETWKRKDIKA